MTIHVQVQHWNEIANGRTGDEAAAVALVRLRDAPWLAHLGFPSNRDPEVVRVNGWLEAFRMFTEGTGSYLRPKHGTSTSGTLHAPTDLLIERLDLDDALHRRTADVANHALFDELPDRHYAAAKDIGTSIPADVWPNPSELEEAGPEIYAMQTIGDYLHKYIRLLFIEIYAGDVAEPHCTYFRDQLGWFLAGFLPCGWEGDWPHGRMRVF